MDLDQLEDAIRETEHARTEGLLWSQLDRVRSELLTAIERVPRGASRGRDAGATVRLALSAATFSNALCSHAEIAIQTAADAEPTARVASVKRALTAMLEAAHLAGMARAYADTATARKTGSAVRKPTAVDQLVVEYAQRDMPAPLAAEQLRAKHLVPRAQVTLERRILSARKKLRS